MPTSTKRPPRPEPVRPTQSIGRDGNQFHNVRHAKITIGDTGRGTLAKIAAVATIVATVLAILAFTWPPAKHDVPLPPSSSPVSAPAVFTRIVNAGTDGVFTYPEPRRGSHFPDGYLDGTVVGVVCQERHGDEVRDRDPAPGQPSAWAVWDRLTTGRWIPDLWTSLAKRPGETPPNNLPTC